MILINITAPAADHIAAGVGEQGVGALQTLGVAAVEGIQRYPVGTLSEERLIVDKNLKLLIGRCGANTDGSGIGSSTGGRTGR